MSFDDLVTRCNTAAHGRFAVAAVITRTGYADKPVNVIFDLNSLDSMGVLSDKPQILIRDTDLSGVDLKLSAITVTGKFPAARITRPLPDGTGWSIAHLTRI